MPRKRKASKMPPPKGEKLTPLRGDGRRWYQSVVTSTVDGLAKLAGIFRRRKKVTVASPPRGARRRRKI